MKYHTIPITQNDKNTCCMTTFTASLPTSTSSPIIAGSPESVLAAFGKIHRVLNTGLSDYSTILRRKRIKSARGLNKSTQFRFGVYSRKKKTVVGAIAKPDLGRNSRGVSSLFCCIAFAL